MFYAMSEKDRVKWFSSKSDRDEYVFRNRGREALTNRLARRYMVIDLANAGFDGASFADDSMSVLRDIYSRHVR
mgnify:CR=1 FL=1